MNYIQAVWVQILANIAIVLYRISMQELERKIRDIRSINLGFIFW